MELPFTPGTEVTPMAAACYPLARAAATGIEQDVLDLIAPKPKREAQALAALLQRGAIFDKCQRRLNFPQKCRSKIPHLLGSGDQPAQ